MCLANRFVPSLHPEAHGVPLDALRTEGGVARQTEPKTPR
jgi:hypothetical protein